MVDWWWGRGLGNGGGSDGHDPRAAGGGAEWRAWCYEPFDSPSSSEDTISDGSSDGPPTIIAKKSDGWLAVGERWLGVGGERWARPRIASTPIHIPKPHSLISYLPLPRVCLFCWHGSSRASAWAIDGALPALGRLWPECRLASFWPQPSAGSSPFSQAP